MMLKPYSPISTGPNVSGGLVRILLDPVVDEACEYIG